MSHVNAQNEGYRIYSVIDLNRLGFVRQAENLGLSRDQIRLLSSLWQDKHRSSQEVKELALRHIAESDERIRELQAMRQTIAHLAEHCHGDERPECPILEGLAEQDDGIHHQGNNAATNRRLKN